MEQDQFDAILYLGPQSSITYSTLTASQCADQEYLRMRLGRMQLRAGSNDDSVGKELREYCAKKLVEQ